jgi:hypothetical protein
MPAVEHRGDLGRSQALLGDARAQLARDVAAIDGVVLGLARVQRGGLRRSRAGLAAVLHALDDLSVAAALVP